MDALIKSIGELFADQHRYVVPAYQRPYVWTEGKQWEPLWEDIERVADSRLSESDSHHFLGAIVIRREHTPPGGITEWSVIDGQQRLTTLQIVLSAIAAAAADGRLDLEARRLRRLIRHSEDDAEGDARFKFWPTSVNRDAFRSAMQAAESGAAVDDDPDNTIHEAWAYFRTRAEEYAHEDAASEEDIRARYAALREAVTGLLQLVTISLAKDDPAQVIFETLNARGTPLLAMDLVKNALFEKAERQGAAVEGLHAQYWTPELGDQDYWGSEVRLGRIAVPRSEAFLMHWLTMRLGRVIPADQLFQIFRAEVLERDTAPAVDLVEALNADARILRNFDKHVPGTAEHRFFQTLESLDTTTMHPLALLLFRSGLEPVRLVRALEAIESYLIRRMLRGLSTKNYTQLAARLVARLHSDIDRADEIIVDELLSSESDTYRWPTDDELEAHLLTRPMYGWISQTRIVFVLGAIERNLRKGKIEALQLPPKLQIEHIMPQSWREHWPVPDDEDAVRDRTRHVDLLGNLTLVTGPLNAAMSNAAWPIKKQAIKQSLLAINHELTERETWDEAGIGERGRDLTKRIARIWPGPQQFMPADWKRPEAESWPDQAEMSDDEARDVYARSSTYVKELLDNLAAHPGQRRTYAAIEQSLDWPRGRLASVMGGYATKTAPQFGGRRPWRLHLDEDGMWWMWLDQARAEALMRLRGDGAPPAELHP